MLYIMSILFFYTNKVNATADSKNSFPFFFFFSLLLIFRTTRKFHLFPLEVSRIISDFTRFFY